jgi:hypothetical protein
MLRVVRLSAGDTQVAIAAVASKVAGAARPAVAATSWVLSAVAGAPAAACSVVIIVIVVVAIVW